MSTATATRSNTPTAKLSSGADIKPTVMPENTAWGFQQRIMAEFPDTNKNYAKRVAYRMKRRMDSMTEVFDFYEALRILGMTTDTTARQAEHRATCRKLECDTCGRTSWKQHA